MNLEINVHETVDGDLFVKELAYEQGEYADSVDSQFTNDTVLFNESASITVLVRHTTTSTEITKAFIHDHSSTEVSNRVPVRYDGWHEVVQCVVPTFEWVEQAIDAGCLDGYDAVFYTDKSVVYAYDRNTGESTETDIGDMLDSDGNCTFWMVSEDTFTIFNLWQCYLNYCKRLFEGNCDTNASYSNCDDCDDEETKKRNLLWILLNALQYLVGFGEMEEAQELLEEITGCNGLCSNEMYSKDHDCGCVT